MADDLTFEKCAILVARDLAHLSEARALQTADEFERNIGFDAGLLIRRAREINAA